jgi:hypothetical protein
VDSAEEIRAEPSDGKMPEAPPDEEVRAPAPVDEIPAPSQKRPRKPSAKWDKPRRPPPPVERLRAHGQSNMPPPPGPGGSRLTTDSGLRSQARESLPGASSLEVQHAGFSSARPWTVPLDNNVRPVQVILVIVRPLSKSPQSSRHSRCDSGRTIVTRRRCSGSRSEMTKRREEGMQIDESDEQFENTKAAITERRESARNVTVERE